MKRFLFLDDTKARHERFDRICETLDVEVWHAYTVKDAITRLNNIARFDCAFLDHDLEERDEWNGWVVAKYIALHMPSHLQPLGVVIHSCNPDGALDMERILKENGYTNVRRVPFSYGSAV